MNDRKRWIKALTRLKAALGALIERDENAFRELLGALKHFRKTIEAMERISSSVSTVEKNLNALYLYDATSDSWFFTLNKPEEKARKLIGKIEEILDKSVQRKISRKRVPPPADNAIPVDAGASPCSSGENYAVMQVYFATDRNITENKKPDKIFGIKRAGLSYGMCEVSIPRDHRMGELEAPSIWRLEFRENPKKHVVLLDVRICAGNLFFQDMANRIRQSEKRNAFIFIHGYNVTFENAARRTAQMVYDLAFDGAPVFYSWPSCGKTPAYTVDEENIRWSETNLKGFLSDFFEHSEADNVFLIAHSMGNRALTGALASLLREKPEISSKLREIILTAPDIDADIFKRDIAPALTVTQRPVTLYASSRDLALAASKKVHGRPRAGDSGPGIVLCKGIESIDASNVETGMMGHSYFAETRSVLSDMFHIIRKGQRASERFALRSVRTSLGVYWEFKP